LCWRFYKIEEWFRRAAAARKYHRRGDSSIRRDARGEGDRARRIQLNVDCSSPEFCFTTPCFETFPQTGVDGGLR
jgi:hypothetical protein